MADLPDLPFGNVLAQREVEVPASDGVKPLSTTSSFWTEACGGFRGPVLTSPSHQFTGLTGLRCPGHGTLWCVSQSQALPSGNKQVEGLGQCAGQDRPGENRRGSRLASSLSEPRGKRK